MQLGTRVPATKTSQQSLTCRQPPKGSASLLSLPCQKAGWQRDPRVPAPVPGLSGRCQRTPSPGNLSSGSRESGCFKTRHPPLGQDPIRVMPPANFKGLLLPEPDGGSKETLRSGARGAEMGGPGSPWPARQGGGWEAESNRLLQRWGA